MNIPTILICCFYLVNHIWKLKYKKFNIMIMNDDGHDNIRMITETVTVAAMMILMAV